MSILDNVENIFNKVMTLGVLGFALIILLGNLAGNSGFTAGSSLANLTDGVVNNITSGVGTFFGNAPTWFTLLSVVVILGIIFLVIRKVREGKTGGGADIA